jgi:hypothetical protein
MDDTKPTVTDADIVPDPNAATILLELERTIKNTIADSDRKKADLKKQREMMESALLNDETYRTHTEEAKKAAAVKGKTKLQILQLPENRQLSEKVKELATEIREMNTALSDYLREYQRMSGSTEIETDDGVVREIVYIAKLVKKSSR